MEYIEDAFPGQGYSLLPEDPAKRAHMRVAINLIDGVNGAWYPIYMKKGADEADIKGLQDKLQKVEDFISTHGNDHSPFAMGTANPT